MNFATPSTVYLKDYAPPPFLIPAVELDIDFVDENEARIQATLAVRRNQAAADPAAALELDLDQYNVVAVGDFNAGAMENKGLNQ